MTDSEITNLTKKLSSSNYYDGKVLHFVEVNGRKVNVPKGTPGSYSQDVDYDDENNPSLGKIRIPPVYTVSGDRSNNYGYVSLPERLDQIEFLRWLDEASVEELERFGNRELI